MAETRKAIIALGEIADRMCGEHPDQALGTAAKAGPQNIQTGPRGGRYYIAQSGEHIYVDKNGQPVKGGGKESEEKGDSDTERRDRMARNLAGAKKAAARYEATGSPTAFDNAMARIQSLADDFKASGASSGKSPAREALEALDAAARKLAKGEPFSSPHYKAISARRDQTARMMEQTAGDAAQKAGGPRVVSLAGAVDEARKARRDNLQTGPRGGRYYISDSGEHVYVDENAVPVGRNQSLTDAAEAVKAAKALVKQLAGEVGDAAAMMRAQLANLSEPLKVVGDFLKYGRSFEGINDSLKMFKERYDKAYADFTSGTEALAAARQKLADAKAAQAAAAQTPAPRPAPAPAATAAPRSSGDARIPGPGATIVRKLRGKPDAVVKVTEAGFEYNGQTYSSLGAVSAEISGAYRPLAWWGLGEQAAEARPAAAVGAFPASRHGDSTIPDEDLTAHEYELRYRQITDPNAPEYDDAVWTLKENVQNLIQAGIDGPDLERRVAQLIRAENGAVGQRHAWKPARLIASVKQEMGISTPPAASAPAARPAAVAPASPTGGLMPRHNLQANAVAEQAVKRMRQTETVASIAEYHLGVDISREANLNLMAEVDVKDMATALREVYEAARDTSGGGEPVNAEVKRHLESIARTAAYIPSLQERPGGQNTYHVRVEDLKGALNQASMFGMQEARRQTAEVADRAANLNDQVAVLQSISRDMGDFDAQHRAREAGGHDAALARIERLNKTFESAARQLKEEMGIGNRHIELLTNPGRPGVLGDAIREARQAVGFEVHSGRAAPQHGAPTVLYTPPMKLAELKASPQKTLIAAARILRNINHNSGSGPNAPLEVNVAALRDAFPDMFDHLPAVGDRQKGDATQVFEILGDAGFPAGVLWNVAQAMGEQDKFRGLAGARDYTWPIPREVRRAGPSVAALLRLTR